MCLKNPYLLEWFCLHQPGRGLWLPLSLRALLLWWLPPWRRVEAQRAGVDSERRQVFRLFLQGEAGVVRWKVSLFFLSFPLCSPSPSVSTQLLIHRSPVVPEKDSVLISTTANDDARWQADLLGMRWGVGVAKRLLNAGAAGQRSQWVPLLRAGSAFKVGWVRALMSPHLLLLQSCWLKLLFPQNDRLHELAHSSGDVIQNSKAQRLVVARDRWTSETL